MGYIEDLRKVVGNQPLILVGVAVAVINERGEFLLQKRSDGLWGVPGGFIELGESTEEAGRRPGRNICQRWNRCRMKTGRSWKDRSKATGSIPDRTVKEGKRSRG